MKPRTNSQFDIYFDPAELQSLGSMEGIPEYEPALPAALPGERYLLTTWQRYLHRGFNWMGIMAPGVGIAMTLAIAGAGLSNWIGKSLMGLENSPVSPILTAVLLGLLIRNIAGLPEMYEKGLRLCLSWILRMGVALLGLRLSITAVGTIGFHALPIVVLCISIAILAVSWLSRLLGISNGLGTLIAVGTSICGISAVIATGTATRADEDEVSYAVAVITLFGMVALFTYPFLAYFLFQGNPEHAGLFLGTSIHDTSQVAGAGLMYQMYYDSPMTLEVAATTKLVRNVFMGLVIPILVIAGQRRHTKGRFGETKISWLKWNQWIPLFLLGFICLAIVRSIGDIGPVAFGLLKPESWQSILQACENISLFFLSTAIAAIGLGTNVSKLRILGWKPFIAGFFAAVLVGGVSYLSISIFY